MVIKKELEREAMKSGRVFKTDFTDGKDIYHFRIGRSDEYIRVFINGKEIYRHQLKMVWSQENSKILVITPTGGQFDISYGSLNNNNISLTGEIIKTLEVVVG